MIKVVVTDSLGNVLGDRYRAETQAIADEWIADTIAKNGFGPGAVFTSIDITAEVKQQNQDALDRADAIRLAKLAVTAINNATTVADLKPILRNIVKFIALG